MFDPPPDDEPADEESVLVRLKEIRLERQRQFGDVWLALGLWRLLGLDTLLAELMPPGREEVPWAVVAAILTLARFCRPSSELHIETTWYRGTSLDDLLGVAPEKVHTDRLHAGLDQLLPHKEVIEKHLKGRLGDLFDLEYELLLYDVTSTYFEGQCRANPMAQRGYSRDKRPDCLQVCIALVLARSAERRAKERAIHAIHQRFVNRMEEGLKKLQAAAVSGRLKDRGTANRRLGRLQGENSRAARAFEVNIETLDPPQDRAHLRITWTRSTPRSQWAELSEGYYLLRSNLKETDAGTLWKRYIQLTDAEWAFRITKDELVIRPIWHHKEDRVKAHLLVCFLAYVLWKTLAQWMSRCGLGDAPRPLLSELSNVRRADVVLPVQTRQGDRRTVCLRCVTEPNEDPKIFLNRLGLTLPRRLRRVDENPPL